MNIPKKEEIKTENKEECMQSMRDEKPENTGGGRILFIWCRNCGWQDINPTDDRKCPQCDSKLDCLYGKEFEIYEKSNIFPIGDGTVPGTADPDSL